MSVRRGERGERREERSVNVWVPTQVVGPYRRQVERLGSRQLNCNKT